MLILYTLVIFIKLTCQVRRLEQELRTLFRRTISSLSPVLPGCFCLLTPPLSKVKSVNLKRKRGINSNYHSQSYMEIDVAKRAQFKVFQLLGTALAHDMALRFNLNKFSDNS